MLAVPDDDDDPFLTLHDDENEQNDCEGYGLTSFSYSALSARYLLCVAKAWDYITCAGVAFEIALLNVIVLALV